MTAAEYLIADASGNLEREHLAVLESIEFSSRQMLAAIEDLSEFASIESGIRISRAPEDIARLVQGTVIGCRPLAQRNRIAVDFQAEPDPPKAAVDVPRIRGAFQRMILWSVSTAPPGSRIDIRVRRSRQSAIVSVGNATPARPRPRDPRPTLSVLLVERIAEAHGGTLVWDCESGGGTFQLMLPLPERPRRTSRSH